MVEIHNHWKTLKKKIQKIFFLVVEDTVAFRWLPASDILGRSSFFLSSAGTPAVLQRSAMPTALCGCHANNDRACATVTALTLVRVNLSM